MSDFTTVLVTDSAINDISDQIVYGVQSGAASNTFQQFSAITASTSQLSFNITVPSESTILDRNLMLNATYTFNIYITGVANTVRAFNYGVNDCLQAFPLNASFNTLSAQINNTSVSINTKDVLPQLINLMDIQDLQRWNSFTPTMPDRAYQNFTNGDAASASNSVFGDYKKATHNNLLLPRGAHPFTINSIVHTKQAGGTDVSLISTNTADTWNISCTVELTEPLILSPFLFNGWNPYNAAGFVGINQINIIANIDTALTRFFSSISTATTMTLSLTSVTNAKILCNFMSSQPSQMVKAKNVIPYVDYPRFITTFASSLASAATTTIISQNIQLNMIPQYFVIVARKQMSTQTCKDASVFLPIRGVSVNFNNCSGLLASATVQDLYRISKANGSQQNYYEFFGYASGQADADSTATLRTPNLIPTGGSLLLLNPALDLSLPDYLSNGSIGQFNIQMNITVLNNTGAALTPELCIIAVNQGVFTTVSGSSSIYSGLLSKDIVLKTTQSDKSISSKQYATLVNGNIDSDLVGGMRCMNLRSYGKGGAQSGGASSGGAYSGGAGSGGQSRLDSLTY